MRRKEEWMFKGAKVTAFGKIGTITRMQENNINGIDYVYYISIKLDGEKKSGQYHPGDISKIN